MIKANELRIGNWVYCHDVNAEVRIAAAGIEDVERSPQRYDPIPLTAEIMEQCGFAEIAQHDNDGDERGYYYVNKKGFVLSSDDFGASFYYNDEVKKVKVEYLHTFQNLYFALESEELQINL